MLNWNATKEEMVLIGKIVDRACGMDEDGDIDRTSISMDITAAHMNGCKLNLQELLESKDSDFGHDVFGISRFINRETGALEDFFVPRCARSA